MTYSSPYKKQKPLSSRLRVETGSNKPDKVKARPAATAKPQGLPSYIKPIRASGKAQGIEVGSSGDVKDYLYSQGDTTPLTPQELHLAQMYAAGNDDALDAF